jgi:hypothetical protein
MVRFSRIHGRVPELVRVHLAQALIALDPAPELLGQRFSYNTGS